jgi:hypothetical protein
MPTEVQAQIVYNSRILTLPYAGPGGTVPVTMVPATRNTTLTGVTETISLPRVDTAVQVRLKLHGLELRCALENFCQWAQQGGQFTFAADSTRKVSTLINGAVSSSATAVVVDSATGIAAGRDYAIISGTYYQAVLVTSVAGTTVNLLRPLDRAVADNAVFRDRMFWTGELRAGNTARIEDVETVRFDDEDPIFNFTLQFTEAAP